MSGISPIKHNQLVSPPTSPELARHHRSKKVESPSVRVSQKRVNLCLGPRNLLDPEAASYSTHLTADFLKPDHVSPISYKATSRGNFIYFCHKLNKLEHDEVSNVISIDLSAFDQICPDDFLTYLPLLLSKCPFLEEIIWGYHLPLDEILISFFCKFRNLKGIDLSYCADKLTDRHLSIISRYIPTLTHLNIEYCTEITDQGIEKLAALTKLSSLRLAYLDKVTDSSISTLKKMQSLTYLDLFDTGITSTINLKRDGLNIVDENETIIIDYWPTMKTKK